MDNTAKPYSSIDLRLTTKGKYHWQIKLLFHDSSKYVFRKGEPEDLQPGAINGEFQTIDPEDELVKRLQKIDRLLRDAFPSNTTINVGSGKFTELDPFEE